MTFVRDQLERPAVLTARDLVIPAPRLAEVALQESDRVCRRRSAPVSMPRACILAVVFGPTPWNFATGRITTKASAWSGMIAN